MLALHEILSRLQGVCSPSASGWYSFNCPIHGDKHASAGGKIGDSGSFIFKCHGCEAEIDQFAAACGFSLSDLCSGKGDYVPKGGSAFRPKEKKFPPNPNQLSLEAIKKMADAEFSHTLELLKNEENPVLALSEFLYTPIPAMLAVNHLGIVEKNQYGYDPFHANFYEKDAQGNYVGANRRYPNGDKKQVPNTTRGLTYAEDWDKFPGPIFNVEGNTDPALGYAAENSCVGSPGASNTKYLAEFLYKSIWQDKRQIIVVVENDKKPDGSWPGMAGGIVRAKHIEDVHSCDAPLALSPDGTKDTRQFLYTKGDFRNRESLIAAGKEFSAKCQANAFSYKDVIKSGKTTYFLPNRVDRYILEPIRVSPSIEPQNGESGQSGEDNSPKTDHNHHQSDKHCEQESPNHHHSDKHTDLPQGDNETESLLYRSTLLDKPSCSCHRTQEEHEDDEAVGVYFPPTGTPLPTAERYIHGALNPFAPSIPIDDNPLYFTRGKCDDVFTFFLKSKQKTDSGTRCFMAFGTCDSRDCPHCMGRLRSAWLGSMAAHLTTAVTSGETLHYIECEHSEWNMVKQRLKNADKGKHLRIAIDNGRCFVICNRPIKDSKPLENYAQAMNAVDVALQSIDTSPKEIIKDMVSSSRAWKLPKSDKESDFEFMGKASPRVPISQLFKALWTVGLDPKIIKRPPKGFTAAYGWIIPPDWDDDRIKKLFTCLKSGKADWNNGKSPTWADFAEFSRPERKS